MSHGILMIFLGKPQTLGNWQNFRWKTVGHDYRCTKGAKHF